MNNFYILSNSFEPTTANTNHEQCFIRAFSELGVRATWTFLSPSSRFDKVSTEYKGIKIKYLWSDILSKNRITRYLYRYISFYRFYFSLKKGDTVLLLGMARYLSKLVRRKDIHIFHERTEHPDAVKINSSRKTAQRYLDSCKQVQGLFVISKALKKYFSGIGVDESKIHVVNMVVDNTRFDGLIKTDSQRYIAYCGKASNNKDGVDRLIKAFSIVQKKLPDVKLFIIGDPPDSDSDNINLVKSLNLEVNIVFTGKVEADIIPQILKDASVLALARPDNLQNRYGFPTKLGEYLLTSNPVVITRVGDIPLFLKDGESAYMSDCDDIEAFASNLIKAIENKEEARLIGMNGADVARKNFNYLTETKKIVNVIKNNIL